MKLGQVFLGAFAATAVWLAAGSTVWSQSAETLAAPSAPPVAPVRAVTDDYHGTKVVDPYRYMEDLKDPEVQVWFKGQNDYTRAVLWQFGVPEFQPQKK
jgi:prolyl oligopeptidase